MNNLELQVRGQVLLAEDITVSRPKESLVVMEKLIERAKAIVKVSDVTSQAKASLVARELQGLRGGLEANYRNAKAPILAAGRALDALFKELDEPLKAAYQRIDKLVSGYQDEIRREAEMAEAKRKAEERRIETERQAKIRQLEREREELLMKARLAEEAREKAKAQRQASAVSNQIEAEQISLQLEKENLPVGAIPEEAPKPIGGRPWTQYICEMTDPIALFNVYPDLVAMKLRQAAAQALAKSLDEAGKPLDVPGLSIKKTTRTSFTGAAAIRIDEE